MKYSYLDQYPGAYEQLKKDLPKYEPEAKQPAWCGGVEPITVAELIEQLESVQDKSKQVILSGPVQVLGIREGDRFVTIRQFEY